MSNEPMDLNQAYNYLITLECTIERIGETGQYSIIREGGTVQASLRGIIQIAEECKKQEQVAS